jgi:hypothetical protein
MTSLNFLARKYFQSYNTCPRSSTICTYGRAKIGVACIILFSVLYNIPRFFEVSWIMASDPDPDWPGEANLTSGERPQVINSSSPARSKKTV